MRIGMPLSRNALHLMLLGAGELGKEVIIALQRLGVEVIAVDRYANAPGHQVAHRAQVIAMSDLAALRALIEAERPHPVVPEIEEGIGYPCWVKPVMSSSGKGQSLLKGPDDIAEAWIYAVAGSRVDRGRIIVEGFIDFEYEITLLAVRADDGAGGIGTCFCEPVGHRQLAGDYVECWQAQAMSPRARQRGEQIAAGVTGDLGGRGFFGVELFVNGDQVWFSEESPRSHDTGLVTLCPQRFSEFELHARAILGLPVDVSLCEPGASAVTYGGVDAAAIAFEGVPEALAVPHRRAGLAASLVRPVVN